MAATDKSLSKAADRAHRAALLIWEAAVPQSPPPFK
jgi:hypothetical protein